MTESPGMRLAEMSMVSAGQVPWSTYDGAMKRTIIRFEQEKDGHRRAELECGHYQHVRHDPPLISREWVLTGTGRAEKVGAPLECRKCGDVTPIDRSRRDEW